MSQRYLVRIEGEAEADLYAIYRYIAETLKEPRIAANIYQKIKTAILELSHMPERIKLMDDEPWHSRGFRKLIVGSYAAIFFVEEQTVHVFRVMYGGMDIDAQLET